MNSCVDNPSVYYSGVFTPFQCSRKVAPIVPSLFTLLFSSIYSALQRHGAPRSRQLFHYEGNRQVDCTSLLHDTLWRLTTVAVMTAWLHLHVFQCRHEAQSTLVPMSGLWASSQWHKINLPCSTFDYTSPYGKQFCEDLNMQHSHTDDLQ